jgi:hypothetical protein
VKACRGRRSTGEGAPTTFPRIDPFLAAQAHHKVLPIWDLCHYGYPDDCDPFADGFADRFAAYAKAAATYVGERGHGPHFFTPINEITFFGYMAGDGAGPRRSQDQARPPPT